MYNYSGVDSLTSLLEKAEANLVLVDFYAAWCEPCKWLEELLLKIEPILSENVVILKVDIDQFPQLQELFLIKSVPVIALFKKGELVWRMNGFLPENEFVEKVKSFFDPITSNGKV
jgi:thioredoxin 1